MKILFGCLASSISKILSQITFSRKREIGINDKGRFMILSGDISNILLQFLELHYCRTGCLKLFKFLFNCQARVPGLKHLREKLKSQRESQKGTRADFTRAI